MLDSSNNILTSNSFLSHFGLTHDGGRRWATTTPVVLSDVSVSRAMFAPSGTDYMRYVDRFTNTGSDARVVLVSWGRNLGSDGRTTLAATSSGDLTLDTADFWAVTIENSSFDPAGPATDPPVGYAFRAPTDSTFVGTGRESSNPFETPWPGNGNDRLSYVFRFTLAPGESKSLAYFLYRGLEENTTGPLGQMPTTGEEIALAETTVAGLVTNPNFSDLSASERTAIINWPLALGPAAPVLSATGSIVAVLLLAAFGISTLRGRTPH